MSKFNPYFTIMVAIPLLLVCYYLIQAIEALKTGTWIAGNWGWLVVGLLVVSTPLLWRCYKTVAGHLHDSNDRHATRALIQAATAQVQLGYNLKYVNQKTGDILELACPFPASFSSRVTVQEDLPLSIEGPQEAIPPIVRYSEIANQIPANQTLLGIFPHDGSLKLTDWLKLKCLWIIGSSSTGKSNTVYGKALEAVNKGAKLLVIDQHATKEDSLARKLQSLSSAFVCPVAVSDEDVLQILSMFKGEFERRVSGASCKQKVVLICDEMNRMVRNETLKKPLQEIVAICGEESRGFGMFGWFISQKAAHLKWLRDSAITVIAHRVTRFEEALLACNDDRQAAKRLLEFPVGRSYIYGVDFDEPLELQQPLYDETVSDDDGVFPDTETNGDAVSLRLLPTTDTLDDPSTKEKNNQVEAATRETVRRMKEAGMPDRDISKFVGLSGRKYGMYQQVLAELGYVQTAEEGA